MNSSLLLMAHFRYRILIGVAIVALLSFIISMSDTANNTSFVFLAVMTFAAMASMNLPVSFQKLLFPVTDRQIAYIPLAVWGVMFVVGLVAFSLGAAINAKPAEIDFPIAFRMLLIFIVLLLFLNRMLSVSFYMIIYFWFPLQAFFNRSLGVQSLISEMATRQSSMVPVLFALWFLLHEAPLNIRASRQLPHNTQELPLSIPVQRDLKTIIANSALIFLVMLACGQMFVSSAGGLFSESWPIALLWLGVLGIIGAFIWHCWRLLRASGFYGSSALWRLLVLLTWVGWPWRFHIGLRSGTVSTCKNCRVPRMAWMATCPHCQAVPVAGKPDAETPETESAAPTTAFWEVNGEAFFYRWVIPCVLLCLLYASWVAARGR